MRVQAQAEESQHQTYLPPQWDEPFDEVPFAHVDLNQFGVDPNLPTPARPGSDLKVKMLAARYASGLPLWHTEDCNDHGEADNLEGGELELVGVSTEKSEPVNVLTVDG